MKNRPVIRCCPIVLVSVHEQKNDEKQVISAFLGLWVCFVTKLDLPVQLIDEGTWILCLLLLEWQLGAFIQRNLVSAVKCSQTPMSFPYHEVSASPGSCDSHAIERIDRGLLTPSDFAFWVIGTIEIECHGPLPHKWTASATNWPTSCNHLW